MTAKMLVLSAEDNVATCLDDMAAGTRVDVTAGGEPRTVVLVDDIAFGHKFAVSRIDAGATVVKYGEAIGIASTLIEPGGHVHVHNVESVRARGDRPHGGET